MTTAAVGIAIVSVAAVGVAIVSGDLHERAEAKLGRGSKVAEQAETGEDVLAEADDRGRLRRVGGAGAARRLELAQRARQLESLAVVSRAIESGAIVQAEPQ